ncbi:MAG TPA: 2,3-bisphosphoglycerate-independent phosphoglycerate mutase, partial [Acidobacteriota bacterium]|nr:2,3-bisphosphoglycerate-independent phosphoglycerate mutase [Acidobacteriota bacterium]
ALLDLAGRFGLRRVFIHFFADGRDTPPRSALTYLERLERRLASVGIGAVASVMGRYYAMDRDQNADRTRHAYDALVLGQGLRARSAREAILAAYARADSAGSETADTDGVGPPETDEFIRPTLICDAHEEPIGLIRDGDSVIFFNYRQDRAVQLTAAFVEPEFTGFTRTRRPDINFLGLTRYYDSFTHYLLPPMNMSRILGEVLAEHGLWQLRISETQKFRHVTSFFNSKREEPFPREDRILVASPKVPENTKPELSAFELTEVLQMAIDKGIAAACREASRRPGVTMYPALPNGTEPEPAEGSHYDFVILNLVNCDMVGHTGDFAAVVKAVETVDTCVGKVVDSVLAANGRLLITADHGNAEQMIDPNSGGPQTAHTLNEVECVYVGTDSDTIRLRPRGILSDIGPTILHILGLPQPAEMTARSLIEKED